MIENLFTSSLIRILALLVTVTCATFTLTSCTTTREVLNLDTSAVLFINARTNVNPDQDDRPSPIAIRVFALQDDRQFRREDFLSLYENAGERLGADLVDTFHLKALAPGESREEVLELRPEVNFIGFMAEYLQYNHRDAQPLLVLPLTPHKKNTYAIEAEWVKITGTED